MKNLITIILMTFLFSTISQAQFVSVKSGGKWYFPSTWSNDPNASAIPDSTSDVIVNHEINIDCGGSCKNLTVNSGGRLHNGGITVYGNLSNSGTINGRDEWNGMHINIKGDLTNNGYYDADTDFRGDANQEIVSADTIRLGHANDYNPSSKIILRNKFVISDTWLFLRGAELELMDTLFLHKTCLDGGVINGNNNVLFGIEHENSIGWVGAVSFSPNYTELKNIKLEGINYVGGNGAIGTAYGIGFEENVVNNGLLVNTSQYPGGFGKVHILNDFKNNGRIAEQQDGLYFDIHNAYFENNGTLESQGLNFEGTCMFSSTDSVALGRFNGTDSNTTVTLSDDLFFKERTVTVDFNGGTLNLSENGKFYATFMWYNQLKNININTNNSIISFTHVEENVEINNPKIDYLGFRDNSTLVGDIEVVEDGTLIAYSNAYPTVTIEGNLKNYGDIRNHYTSGSLKLNITGNIIHDGAQWSNIETKIIGTNDQVISIPNDSSWTGKVILNAMLDGTSYQWQKNGSDISGATAKEFILSNGISPEDYGEYLCVVDSKNSRKIIIGDDIPTTFEIYDVVITNLNSTETKVEWNTNIPASGFIFYAEEDTTNGFPLEAMEPEGFRLEHSLTLSNLTSGANYYFIIDQNDQNWNIIRSSTYNFIAGDTSGNSDETFVERIEGMKKLQNTPGETGCAYYDASFISKDVAYVVTNHNKLFKTTDGGITWKNISPEPDTDFDKIGNMSKVHFINESIGAVAFSVDDGANGYDYSKVFGYVWCTTDGGETWSQRFDVNKDQILHLKQATETVVYVSGAANYGVSSNRWFKKITRDEVTGNYSIEDVTPTPTTRPHVVAADWVNENTGVAVGRLNVNPFSIELFRTDNGAISWNSIQSNLPSNNYSTNAYSDQGVQMLDSNKIVFVYGNKEGDQYITRFFRSDDGGSNWASGNFDILPAAYPNIFFDRNGTEGILTGISTDSTKIFYYTEDGGANWIHYVLNDLPKGQVFFSSGISYDGTIWAAGNNNGIWKSNANDSTVSVSKQDNIPSDFALMQNYPNPFNPSTMIEFTLPQTSDVNLTIYNLIGEKVKELIKGTMTSGKHSVVFNAENLSSGIYFYRISVSYKTGSFVKTRKMILLK